MEATTTNRSIPEVCHLASFAGLVIPFGNILGPLGVWFWKRDTDPVMANHGREALNFQISMSIYTAVVLLTTMACLPLMPKLFVDHMKDGLFMLLFPLFMAAPLLVLTSANFGLTIWATIKAYQGSSVRYPFTIRFVRQ